MSQDNLQTMIMQNFFVGKRGVLWDCASSEYSMSIRYQIIHFLKLIKLYMTQIFLLAYSKELSK